MSKRTILAIAVVLMIGVPGALHAGSARSSEPDLTPFWTGIWGTVVIDANGKMVGALEGLGDSAAAIVALAIAGHSLVFVRVFPDRITSYQGTCCLQYESTNCSGSAYSIDPGGMVPRVHVGAPGSTVYIGEGSQRTINTRSLRHEDGTCVPTQGTSTVVPMIPTVNLDSFFAPPFRVEGGRPLP